jgi:hypothetical protein
MKTSRIKLKYRDNVFGNNLCWIFTDNRWAICPSFGRWGLSKKGVEKLKSYLNEN